MRQTGSPEQDREGATSKYQRWQDKAEQEDIEHQKTNRVF
jgi:hypothetical protein